MEEEHKIPPVEEERKILPVEEERKIPPLEGGGAEGRGDGGCATLNVRTAKYGVHPSGRMAGLSGHPTGLPSKGELIATESPLKGRI